jgi:hypothetical protein
MSMDGDTSRWIAPGGRRLADRTKDGQEIGT